MALPDYLGELESWLIQKGFAKRPIPLKQLQNYPGDSTKFARGDGTWATTSGQELDYAQITAPVSITALSFATATTLITGNAVTCDGSTAVLIEVFTPHLSTAGSGGAVFLNIWDGSTDLGIIAKLNSVSGGVAESPIRSVRKLTPSAASHTFSVRGTMNSGTGTFGAGAGGTGGTELPALLRITKA